MPAPSRTDYGAFDRAVRAFAEKTKKRIDNTLHEVCLGVAASLVSKSPVGDPMIWKSAPYWPKGYVPGTFKANWRASVGSIDYTTTEETDPTGELSMVNINETLSAISLVGTHIYITNSLPYARILEEGAHSKQVPPAGMVGLTVLEFQEIVNVSIYKTKMAAI
jgi:hypothetical protein